jgi:hypothetical protein
MYTRPVPWALNAAMPLTALPAAREQLKYWQEECEQARLAGDTERIARCEHFILQMELVISALERAAQHIPQSKSA